MYVYVTFTPAASFCEKVNGFLEKVKATFSKVFDVFH